MGFYRFADRVFELKNKYAYTDRLCADYAAGTAESDYVIEVSDDERNAERVDNTASFPEPYLESLAIYRKIASCLAREDCFLIHAAVIEYRGRAYAFTAKSRVGKSTNISLWKKAFGEDVREINGDKPLVRRVVKDGRAEFIAYGTPWCGKERKYINGSSVLAGFCVLERSEENFIERADESVIPSVLGQMILKTDAEYLSLIMSFANDLFLNVPIYRLGVNMDISAAVLARDVLCKN